MSNSLRPHGLQHSRLPCPSPSPGVCLNLCPLSRWCHPTILSSVVPFSSYLQSFPAWGSFSMSRLFASGGQLSKLQLQHQSFLSVCGIADVSNLKVIDSSVVIVIWQESIITFHWQNKIISFILSIKLWEKKSPFLWKNISKSRYTCFFSYLFHTS